MEKSKETVHVYKKPNMDSFTTIRSLATWELHFSIPGMIGADKVIKPLGTIDLLNREIKLCCDNSNVFFVGTGKGNHARVFVEDADMRIFVGFDSEDGKRKQIIINDEICQKLFDLKTMSTFEKNVNESIVTEHEKDYIMNYARKNKVNDYAKISYLENYTQKKFNL